MVRPSAKTLFSTQGYAASIQEITKKFPIKSIEDPFAEDDWDNWKELTEKTNTQIVGDDLFVTNKNPNANKLSWVIN